MKNYGFLPPPINDKEYWLGGISGILQEDRNTTADWRMFLPTEERQNFRNFDDFGCVSHAALNSIECQFHWLIYSNLINDADLNWLKEKGYFDELGKINFDDRWLVVLSNTKPGVGNYVNAVWDAIRKYGLIPQGLLPFSEDWNINRYYLKSDFTPEMYAIGKEFLKRFAVQYERVQNNIEAIQKALRHAPVQIGAPTCDGWFSEVPVKTCNEIANHSNVVVSVNDLIYDFDSYKPFIKKLDKNYKIDFAYKGVITPMKSVTGQQKVKYIFNNNLKFGDYNNEVTQLAIALIKTDCLTDYVPSPHYGPEIANAVVEFQRKYNAVSFLERIWYRGRYFGPKTRLALNNLYYE